MDADEWMATYGAAYRESIDAGSLTLMAEGGPFHTQGYLEKYCTHLEETGRGDLAEKLKAKYPEALRDNY